MNWAWCANILGFPKGSEIYFARWCNIFTRRIARNSHSLDLEATIQRITQRTVTPLVPEIYLNLITPNCELWNSRPELCPIADPYWAFLWPGGQALCRYLLDNPYICRQKDVLDIGSGGGASVIASLLCGANFAVVNDIDKSALAAAKMNIKKNLNIPTLGEFCFTVIGRADIEGSKSNVVINVWLPQASYPCGSKVLHRVLYSSDNVLPVDISSGQNRILSSYFEMCKKLHTTPSVNFKTSNTFDVVTVGDLFYDEDISSRLLSILLSLKQFSPNTTILIGDPGRPSFLEHLRPYCNPVVEHDLPAASVEENYGFSRVVVYRLT